MNTWNVEEPPELAPVALAGRVRGAVRLSVLVPVTLIAVVLFLIGRGLRDIFGHYIVFHFGVARLWSRVCLRLLGMKLRVSGVPVTSGSLIANHSSWIDILALRSVRLIYFVSKAEVANWPGIGFVTRITGTVFIERRRSQAKLQEQLLRERMAADQLLCFFPEGTSSDGMRVLPFKSSLFSAFYEDGSGTGLPLQPVTLRYRPAPGSGLPENFYGWWGDMRFDGHIWQVMCRSRGGIAEVIFHPALSAGQFGDRKQLADHCRRMVLHGMESGGPHLAVPPPLSAGETA